MLETGQFCSQNQPRMLIFELYCCPLYCRFYQFMTILLEQYPLFGTNTGTVFLDWYLPKKIQHTSYIVWFALLWPFRPSYFSKLQISTLYLFKQLRYGHLKIQDGCNRKSCQPKPTQFSAKISASNTFRGN